MSKEFEQIMQYCKSENVNRVTGWDSNAHNPCLVYRWVQDEGGTRARVYGQSVGTRLSISLGRYATLFQVEIFAILVYAHEIQFQDRPEKHVFAPTARQP